MDKMDEVQSMVETEKERSVQPVVVVSAFSGVTNELIQIADKIYYFDCKKGKKEACRLFFQIMAKTLLRAKERLTDQEDCGQILQYIEQYLAAHVKRVVDEIWPFLLKPANATDAIYAYVKDRIIGLGEIFSAHVLANVFSAKSKFGLIYEEISLHDLLPSPWSMQGKIDAWRKKIIKLGQRLMKEKNDGTFHDEEMEERAETYDYIRKKIRERVTECINRNVVPILTGYMGYMPGSILHFIDRGYSDTTAALTAIELNERTGDSCVLEIWKEVDGLLSADPKTVPNPVLREQVSLAEVGELADLGGMKAVNAQGVWVLMHSKKETLMLIKNTFNPEAAGTLVTAEGDPQAQGIRFISGKKGQTLIRVENVAMIGSKGWASKIFGMCAKLDIAVDVITTSGASVSFSIESDAVDKDILLDRLKQLGQVSSADKMALVCCVGTKMRNQVGLLGKVANILGESGINIEFDGGDPDRNITFVIEDKNYEEAIRALHEGLFKAVREPASVSAGRK